MHDSNDTQPDLPGDAGTDRGFDAQRDIVAGRDIAGRDIVTQTTYGVSQQTLVKLVIAVGTMVFITAACFFSGGVAVGIGALAALNRQVGLSPEAARSMGGKLNELQTSAPNQAFDLTFSEEEIDSYFRLVIGPEVGVTEGKVRLLEPGRLIISGRAQALSNLPLAAIFEMQDHPGEPLHLLGAAVQILQFQSASFGWVAVPTALLQPLTDQVNESLGTNYRVTDVREVLGLPEAQPAWLIGGVTTDEE